MDNKTEMTLVLQKGFFLLAIKPVHSFPPDPSAVSGWEKNFNNVGVVKRDLFLLKRKLWTCGHYAMKNKSELQFFPRKQNHCCSLVDGN